jgi:hypothetical protein
MVSADPPLLSQAAALLYTVVTHNLPASCSLEQLETLLQRLSQEIARQAAEQYVQAQATAREGATLTCACGQRLVAEQRRPRAVLLLFGLLRLHLRRYRCPACGTWRCPGAERWALAPQQRMSGTLQELVTHFGLSWSYHVAAVLLGRVLPGAAVSAKTVERVTKRSARRRQAAEDAAAQACQALPPALGERAAAVAAQAGALPAFAQPARVYVGLDGILVRGRAAKQWLEVQVGSLWSAWRDVLDRQHPRREITDRTLVARSGGWEPLGAQVWRVFVQRGGLRAPRPEVVVLGDGAAGIRSLWEHYFPHALALLDPWHLWEKVKARAREVLGDRERALGAAQVVYARLRRGAVEEARELIAHWPATTAWACARRERLLAFLQRNRDRIGDYAALRARGYLTGSGLTEKANDLVVAPRMKNGKMHWSRPGANAVALLRAHVLNDPHAPLLPT